MSCGAVDLKLFPLQSFVILDLINHVSVTKSPWDNMLISKHSWHLFNNEAIQVRWPSNWESLYTYANLTAKEMFVTFIFPCHRFSLALMPIFYVFRIEFYIWFSPHRWLTVLSHHIVAANTFSQWSVEIYALKLECMSAMWMTYIITSLL